ncbi:MAG: threonine/serine exporter [Epsilonproteobacteria bacterium]|nr:threonine/serine exporter [Campylobacterota bacterium]
MAVMLLEYGAESRLIEQIASRLGVALGCTSIQISLIPSAIVLTTLIGDASVTTTRRAQEQPINLSIVHQIVTICIAAEQNPRNIMMVEKALDTLHANPYPSWVLIPIIGLSCAAFSHLQGADWVGFGITFLAASGGMLVRKELSHRNYSLLIVFAFTAFVCTLIASLAFYDNLSHSGHIVLSSSVLLLVPGLPYINSMLDAFKGYISMGWGRWTQATLLTLMSSLGIMLAMGLLGLKGW